MLLCGYVRACPIASLFHLADFFFCVASPLTPNPPPPPPRHPAPRPPREPCSYATWYRMRQGEGARLRIQPVAVAVRAFSGKEYFARRAPGLPAGERGAGSRSTFPSGRRPLARGGEGARHATPQKKIRLTGTRSTPGADEREQSLACPCPGRGGMSGGRHRA